MSYEKLFYKYGAPSQKADLNIRCYLLKPANLKETKNVAYYDDVAARCIMQCETIVQQLKEYRLALARRYAELETMAFKERLEIERQPHWQGHIEYWVRIVKCYQDGSEVITYSKRYKGKERREAIKRFEELKKSRPGIDVIKDIEKRQWEK